MEMANTDIKFARVQSASSINTYKQCPRKYYYQYIEKLESLPNIHQVRGKIIHSSIETFFTVPPEIIGDDFRSQLRIIAIDIFNKVWEAKDDELMNVGISKAQLNFYYEESLMLILNWYNGFMAKLAEHMLVDGKQFVEAFNTLKPLGEVYIESQYHGIHGFIDAIHNIGGETVIIDYKTSSSTEIKPEYKLQLAIYAMLYTEKHGIQPSRVGINFLRGEEKFIDVDQGLLDFAKKEVNLLHLKTQSCDKCDYPKQVSGLCKWRTGMCDFYTKCAEE